MDNDNDFDRIIPKATEKLFSYALHLTKDKHKAEDLMQESLLKLYKYKDAALTKTDILNLLYIIVRNKFISWEMTKRAKMEKKITYTDDLLNFDYQEEVNEAIHSLTNEEVMNCIALLKEKYSMPYILYHEGYKYEEIAEMLEIPMGTVRSSLHRAKNLITENFFDDFH